MYLLVSFPLFVVIGSAAADFSHPIIGSFPSFFLLHLAFFDSLPSKNKEACYCLEALPALS